MKKKDILKMLEPFDDEDDLAFDGEPHLFSPEVVCGRMDSDMGYKCSLPPNHPGECWSRAKQVNFRPRET